MSLVEALAAWAVDLRIENVPPAARQAACRHMLDGTGTAIAAIRTGAAAPALTVMQGIGNPPEDRLLGSDQLPSQSAAFGMAAAVHALDFDDTHAQALVHPTTVVLPAVLAVGREMEGSGSQLLEAALVGYEVECRLGAATPFGFHAAGVHATSVVGVVGAAAVSAKLLGLDVPAFANALAIAASVSGGLLASLGTGAKQLHPAFAASNGILAARVAAAGSDGSPTVLEGPRGLFATHSNRDFDEDRVTNGLGSEWEVTQISIKPYPCCQLMHAALDATSLARALLDGSASSITSIDAYVHPDSLSIVGQSTSPRDPNDAKFSLAWSAAALLIDGAVTVDTYSPEVIERKDIAQLADKVHTRELDSRAVAAEAPARVAIRTSDRITWEASVPCSKGTPGQPLSLDELRTKFYDNCGGASEAAGQIAAWVLGLEGQGRVNDFLSLTGELFGR